MPSMHATVSSGLSYQSVVVVIHGCQSWVGLFIVSLFCRLVWHLLVPWKLVLREGPFRRAQLRGLWTLCPSAWCHWQQGLAFHLLGTGQSRTKSIACKVLGDLGSSDLHLKRGFLMFGVGVFFRWPLLQTFKCGFWGLFLGPRVCMASTLPTKLSPQFHAIHWITLTITDFYASYKIITSILF